MTEEERKRLYAELLRIEGVAPGTGAGVEIAPAMSSQQVQSQQQQGTNPMMAQMLRGGGSGSGAGQYVAPAVAMYGLVKGGNELGIGAREQGREYKRFGRKLDDEIFQKLKFWEWF